MLAIISLLLEANNNDSVAQLDRAFDYESKGHRFESCWVHHKPPTSFALLAVVFYSFVFLSIVRFSKSLSRALASFKEVEVRDFLLSNHSIISDSSDQLSQILSHRPENAADEASSFNDVVSPLVCIAIKGHFDV